MLRTMIAARGPDRRMVWGAEHSVALADLGEATSLDTPMSDLRGRSVVICAEDQLSAALALIELDGVARRMVVCPPDLDSRHLRSVMADAEAEAIVVGRTQQAPDVNLPVIRCGLPLAPCERKVSEAVATEWALLTSGTAGPPKIVVHTLDSLSGALQRDPDRAPTWATFYDIRRYGGLQIFLRAVIGGGSLVLSHPNESASDHLDRLARRGVTHMTGTPTQWRRALMSPAVQGFRPDYVRLSGEIADQAVLDRLRAQFPDAAIVHAYASTEAGVAFEVHDGREGIPMSVMETGGAVDVRVADGEMLIRSGRTAMRYLGPEAPPLRDSDGFFHTRDMVEQRGERWHFVGRRDGVVNVGGLKVHPEEVEALINRHDRVRASLVKGRPNPITGAIVVAEIVLNSANIDDVDAEQAAAIKDEIFAMCRGALPSHKVPATIRVVAALEMSPGGKLVRRNA